MPLIDLKTDLKSLRYGKDRIGGGDSGQPYIKSNIPDNVSSLVDSQDFLLRGGLNAASDSATDILRLGKMFGDLKSPSGILFNAKQQLLSRTAPRTQTSGILNEGVYTPLSTLAQAGVNAFGGHLNKQGVNPFGTPTLYFDTVKPNPNDTEEKQLEQNRLVTIYQNVLDSTSTSNWNFSGIDVNVGNNILSYGGGPGSDLGIGKTNIRFADQRTGTNNPLSISNPDYFNRGGIKLHTENTDVYSPGENGGLINFKNFILSNPDSPLYEGNKIYNLKTLASPPTINALTSRLNEKGQDLNPATLGTQQLIDAKPEEELGGPARIKQDFRAQLRANLNNSKILSNSPSYLFEDNKTIEGRVNLNNPANPNRNLISYTKGTGLGPVDKINALPIYKSENVTSNPIKNDLVKFRIAVIDNQDPKQKTFIHFRALLGSISDNYTANWNPVKYLGRGEEFFTYGGFGRTVSLDWTIAAQSKEELIPMYKKLNYLASTLAPDYSPNGYMKGNLVQLTVGGYFYEQPGIITSMNLSINDDTPYEVAINDEGRSDKSVKELPMIIRVTGFNFTPIHNFRPSLQNITTPMGNASLTDTNTYGNQRFIALANGSGSLNNNYDS
jgi:hypothetical protein